MSAFRLSKTGQVIADLSKIVRCFSSAVASSGNFIKTFISPILLGLVTIILVISTLVPSRFIFISLALIPIIVNMQVPKAVATKSVGENLSPLPWLSTGASVSITVSLCKCVATVLKFPSYIICDVIDSNFALNLQVTNQIKVKNIVFAVLCTMVITAGYSQGKDIRNQKKEDKKEKIRQLIVQEEQGAIIYQKQSVFGIKLNTDGYGAFYELGRLKTPRKSNLYSFELGERKHSKEEKITSADGGYLSNPYVFGKINNFYYAKLGYAQQRLIGNKGNKNGVAVSALYGGGFSAGLLKPYYLKVADQNNQVIDVKYNNNDDVFIEDPSSILGASGFSKGFGEMKFTPGAFVKTAIRFDYGRYNELVSAVEVGLNIEVYTKKLPVMLLNKERQLFFNAYAAIAFGRRK